MTKKLKHLASVPILGPLFLLLRSVIKRAANLESSRFPSSPDTDDILTEDILIVDAEPYIGQQSHSVQPPAQNDLFYLRFENRFRGSEEAIKSKQAKYIEYVCRAYKLSNKSEYFLDIGCGRGEFLELLDAAEVPHKGLETNKIEYEALVKKVSNVRLGDCNSFLKNIQDNSLIGISVFQVIEHFDSDYLQRFIKLSYEKIAVNGVLILETVNPKCNIALSNFFLDITHVRPYPPETIKFLLEWNGFKDIRIIYSSPCSEEFRIRNIKECNYMDYGVIAWKR
jgi:O-antigen chain-terminating methyltransferase